MGQDPSRMPGQRSQEGELLRGQVDFLAAQYPRWGDFLRLREQRDPHNVFLTDYWRDRFGLWDAARVGAGR